MRSCQSARASRSVELALPGRMMISAAPLLSALFNSVGDRSIAATSMRWKRCTNSLKIERRLPPETEVHRPTERAPEQPRATSPAASTRASISSRIVLTRRRKLWPARVGRIPAGDRSNKGVPTRCSSWATDLLNAECRTQSRSAAFRRLPEEHASTAHRSCFSSIVRAEEGRFDLVESCASISGTLAMKPMHEAYGGSTVSTPCRIQQAP